MQMNMKQQNEMNTIETLGLRFWNYIAKPFQITKVLELLYALDWVWYFSLSLLPEQYVAGSIFKFLHLVTTQFIGSSVLFLIASISIYGLWNNNIRVRKIVLICNIGILLWVFFTNALQMPISGGSGYLLILALLSMFALWRMDVSDN